MAKPTWFSHDQPSFAHDLVLCTISAQPGNWRQGQGGDLLRDPRFVWSWRVNDGPWSAPAQDRAQTRGADGLFAAVPGEGQNTFSYAAFSPGVYKIEFQISAGTYSLMTRSDGSVAWEAYEWGWENVANPGQPYVSGLTVEVKEQAPDEPPPPAPPPAFPAELEVIRFNTLEELRLATSTNPDAWMAQNKGELAALTDYLVDGLMFGLPVQPPSLRTHKGRAGSGSLQFAHKGIRS